MTYEGLSLPGGVRASVSASACEGRCKGSVQTSVSACKFVQMSTYACVCMYAHEIRCVSAYACACSMRCKEYSF